MIPADRAPVNPARLESSPIPVTYPAQFFDHVYIRDDDGLEQVGCHITEDGRILLTRKLPRHEQEKIELYLLDKLDVVLSVFDWIHEATTEPIRLWKRPHCCVCGKRYRWWGSHLWMHLVRKHHLTPDLATQATRGYYPKSSHLEGAR
jgi:hypothetical protein